MASAAVHLSLSAAAHSHGATRPSDEEQSAARGPLAALPRWAWKPQPIVIRDKVDLVARAEPRLPPDPIDHVADALYEIEFEESPELAAAIVVDAVRHVVECRGVVVALRDLDGTLRVAASKGLGGRAALVGAVLDSPPAGGEDSAGVEALDTVDAVERAARYGEGRHAWRLPVVTAGQVSAVVDVVDARVSIDSPDVVALFAMVREHLGEFVAQRGSE